ncbi:hypothetical protein [Streptosporangium canum]|uniref:hypothetical protein n=1 Tax=Streptosporangium canum TaxID=324952 RepID=UPI0037B89CDC
MATTPKPPPVALLIHERRERPGQLKRRVSIRSAAKRAAELSGESFSEPSWRRIEDGTKQDFGDREIVFMAAAINDLSRTTAIGPDDLRKVGCDTAADLLSDYIKEHATAAPILASIDPNLTPDSVQQSFQQMLGEIRALPGVSADERAQMERVLLAQFDTMLRSFGAQLHILRPR